MTSRQTQQDAPVRDLIQEIHEQLPAYVAYVDHDLRYVAANRMYVERFGRPEEQIVGQLVADVTGASFENVARHLRRALAGEEQSIEPRMISVDGERTLCVRHLPHRDDQGNVLGVIVYGYDITEQRRAEEALRQSEKIAAVGRLASSIAHEMNNPLESVVNLMYLVEQTVENDPIQARTYARLAQAELARVSQIATQTLRFFRQSTSRQVTDLADLANSVLDLYAGRLQNSGITVSREYTAPTPFVCLEGELRQALNHLVSNALDAMRTGGRLRLRIRKATHPATERPGMRITVADSGSGIPAEIQPKLFEPFFTTKGILGTGLGLWITRDLIAKENGQLRFRSRCASVFAAQTHGTVFSLFLPDRA